MSKITSYIIEKINTLKADVNILYDYQSYKMRCGDDHAVSDAANDIRELKAQINVLLMLLTYKGEDK